MVWGWETRYAFWRAGDLGNSGTETLQKKNHRATQARSHRSAAQDKRVGGLLSQGLGRAPVGWEASQSVTPKKKKVSRLVQVPPTTWAYRLVRPLKFPMVFPHPRCPYARLPWEMCQVGAVAVAEPIRILQSPRVEAERKQIDHCTAKPNNSGHGQQPGRMLHHATKTRRRERCSKAGARCDWAGGIQSHQ